MGKSRSAIFSYALKEMGFYSLGSNGFVDARDVAKAMIKLTASEIKNDRFLVTGENQPFKNVFEKISEVLRVKKPTKPANPTLANIVYWIEKIRSFLTGSRPLLTQEMIISANLKISYSNIKLKNAIGFEFIPLEDSIKNAGEFYIQNV